jgi:hypothetical protein
MKDRNMKKRLAVSLVFALGAAVTASVSAEVQRNPVLVGTSIDFGRVVQGRFESNEDKAPGQVFTRTGVYLTESGVYENRLSLAVTVGGLFWFPLPEKLGFESRIIRFGPGVGQAQLNYALGDTAAPWGNLQFGLFPIKYNSDSKNLGEYLFRSGTYPGVLYSGGWSYMNSAAYLAQGGRFTMRNFGGKLVHDLALTLERDLEPTNDISPSYMLTWKPTSFFEFGAGVMWAHGIPIKDDSIVSPHKLKNAYDDSSGLPLAYDDSRRQQLSKTHYKSTDPRVQPDGAACLTDVTVPCPNGFNNSGSTAVSRTANGVPGERINHYTFRGIKTSARFSLDLGNLMNLDETLGKDAFKLYGEWALLGVEDQPYFYEKKSERMPIMVGMNIPTFKMLDAFGIEVEYLKSRFQNNIYSLFVDRLPLPLTEQGEDYSVYDLKAPIYTDPTHPDYRGPNGADSAATLFKKDDLKWSIYARKQVTQGLNLYLQVASDHLRHIATDVRPMYTPTTYRSSDWYWLMRLELGI